SQARLSWLGDGSGYSVSGSRTSDWLTTLETSFTSLSCNTRYSFQIRARNGDGLETADSDPVSGTTESCGAWSVWRLFGEPPATTDYAFSFAYTFSRTLARGSVGPDVVILQKRLQAEGYFPKNQTPAPTFGPQTEKALRAFQKAKGLKITGIANELTLLNLDS